MGLPYQSPFVRRHGKTFGVCVCVCVILIYYRRPAYYCCQCLQLVIRKHERKGQRNQEVVPFSKGTCSQSAAEWAVFLMMTICNKENPSFWIFRFGKKNTEKDARLPIPQFSGQKVCIKLS